MKKGFTLIELILTAVILAISISGAITILGGMTRKSNDAEKQTLAVEYGRMRMEQILSKRFDERQTLSTPVDCNNDFSPSGQLRFDTGESQNNFDDVDDLNGWEGEITTDPLYGKGLKSLVSVSYVNPIITYVAGNGAKFGYLDPTGSSTCFKRVTVSVKDNKTNQVLVTLRTMVTPYK